jgi:methionyl-tRNA formyltransferase
MNNTADGVAMLAAPSNRSRIYLDLLERADLLPEQVLVLEDPSVQTAEQKRRESDEQTDSSSPLPEDPDLDTTRTVLERVQSANIPFERFETLDPNERSIVEAVRDLEQEYLVYSGPGGVILDSEILNAGPEFLHVHAGVLPEYRGSTTVYYSLINDDACGATVFLMREELDQGPIVAEQTFAPPEDPETLDLYYDPWIRGQLLTETLEQFQEDGSFSLREQRSDEGNTYFIVHPVLKHIAIGSIADEE